MYKEIAGKIIAEIGQKFGKVKYTVFGGTKSLEGSLTMFVITSVMSVFVWMVFSTIGYPMPNFNLFAILGISAVATICEALSYGAIDNLTVPALTSVLYSLPLIFKGKKPSFSRYTYFITLVKCCQ